MTQLRQTPKKDALKSVMVISHERELEEREKRAQGEEEKEKEVLEG